MENEKRVDTTYITRILSKMPAVIQQRIAGIIEGAELAEKIREESKNAESNHAGA